MHEKSKTCLFCLYATAKSEIQIVGKHLSRYYVRINSMSKSKLNQNYAKSGTIVQDDKNDKENILKSTAWKRQ